VTLDDIQSDKLKAHANYLKNVNMEIDNFQRFKAGHEYFLKAFRDVYENSLHDLAIECVKAGGHALSASQNTCIYCGSPGEGLELR
jgi:hypothetical protein